MLVCPYGSLYGLTFYVFCVGIIFVIFATDLLQKYMKRDENILLAFITGVIATVTISFIVSEKRKRRKLLDSGFEKDRENLSSDLDNIYIDLSNTRKKITDNAQV